MMVAASSLFKSQIAEQLTQSGKRDVASDVPLKICVSNLVSLYAISTHL